MSEYRAFDQDKQRLESMLSEALVAVYQQCTGVGQFDPDKPGSPPFLFILVVVGGRSGRGFGNGSF